MMILTTSPWSYILVVVVLRTFLHPTVSPTAHYQNVLKERRPNSPVVFNEGSIHKRHLSDSMERCTSAYASTSPTPFIRRSPKEDSPYESYPTQQVSSTRIAFAKSQTFTLAEVHKFNENASTLLEQEESLNLPSSESPRISTDYYSEAAIRNAAKETSQPKPNQAWCGTSTENCSLSHSLDEPGGREYEVSGEPLPVVSSSQKLQSLLGPTALSPLSEGYRCSEYSDYSDYNEYDQSIECSDCSDYNESNERSDYNESNERSDYNESNERNDCVRSHNCSEWNQSKESPGHSPLGNEGSAHIECPQLHECTEVLCKSDSENHAENERSISYEYDGNETDDHSPTYDSMTPERESPPKQEEDEYSDIAQLKHNLATRLCFNITACSCQIWLIQNEFMSLVTNNIAVITRVLVKKEYEDLRNKVKLMNAVVEVPIDKVDGRVDTFFFANV